ncbi:type IV pilus modification protein PilV [Desulfosediminicola flagellatus]|uniref:type IV pilus modification protein PilV n=1 Tax=Desulfosediminicola flagellatus TaxID=2569541 RepID=UPI0010ACBE02|nr:type IV pilus modification protein PilV [Desulfosediminicola flagellatus]
MKLCIPTLKQDDGFTLIEALISMLVLSIGILSFYTLQLTSVQQNARASNITVATNWAAEKIEDIISYPYDNLLDVDGDGTSKDTDANGIDDDGNYFGLNDTTIAAKPDGQQNSPDGKYTISWNVALDQPLPGNKTIRVHVKDNTNKMKNVISFQYIKEASI